MDMPERKRRRNDEAVDEISVEASEDDIEIGRVISAQGDDISLDEAFQRIRMTLHGTQTSKEEPAEERLVDCTRICYSQASCARRFRRGPYAGHLLADVVHDLGAGELSSGKV